MALEQSIREELARLIKENVDGITTAPAYSPRTVQDAHLPIVIITPSRAVYNDRLGAENLGIDRDYSVLVLAARMTTGGAGEAEAAATPYFERMRNYLFGLQRIETENEAVEVSLISDGGLAVFTRDAGENAAYFAGIEFIVRVRAIVYIADVGV